MLWEDVRTTGSLPQSTHAVIESYVRSRLARDRERIENRFAVDVGTTRTVAEELAFLMLADPGLGLSASRSVVSARLVKQTAFSADEVESAIDALLYCHLTRYADAEARDRVTFSHRRLQEHFATCAVIRDESAVTPAQLLSDGRWRETAVVVPQTQRVEHSVDLLTAIERRLWTAARDPSTFWPSGALYLLDLMADALTPEDIAQHAVSRAANRILSRAWSEGGRLDQKWVIELCAAAGADQAIGYLARAFASDSLWIRDEAYRQVRRVGPGVATLEPEIRQALVAPLGIALVLPFVAEADRLRMGATTPVVALALLNRNSRRGDLGTAGRGLGESSGRSHLRDLGLGGDARGGGAQPSDRLVPPFLVRPRPAEDHSSYGASDAVDARGDAGRRRRRHPGLAIPACSRRRSCSEYRRADHRMAQRDLADEPRSPRGLRARGGEGARRPRDAAGTRQAADRGRHVPVPH
ncbi:hypothetical protein [Actinoplanes sp. NPDC048796]|uniref:hypothetical protein n=1 Tax=Actinoplanes sp. NPDC048796 TaxID=3155640 RepID=UPI0033EB1C5E